MNSAIMLATGCLREVARPAWLLSWMWLGFAGLIVHGQVLDRAHAQPVASTQAPPDMTARIDELLDQQLREIGWQAAGDCSDFAFVRRAFLDLTGAPPSASEALEFAQEQNPRKREQLVDRLLHTPACAAHLAQTWCNWMLPEETGPQLQAGRVGLTSWLRNRFAENLRYDRLVSDLLVASGPAGNGATVFFISLEGKPEKIAAKTARVFLGLQLDCAECHDHPFDQWSQQDFWGFAAYFGQLSTNSDQNMQAAGDVVDINEGEVTLPGTDQIIAPKPLVNTGLSALDFGTRRQQLTLWLTARENPFVARAAVNRVWALLFGRGLIEPVDDMRNLEMASHPRLLRELSEYFAAGGYDLRNLISTLAKTKAYGRDTLHESGAPPEASYAVMSTKPLTAEQMSTSLSIVARQIVGEENAAAQAALASQLGKLRGDASEAQLGMVSALVTLHGAAFDQVSREGKSRLLAALQAPFMDQHQRVRWLFLSTLSREPTAGEFQALSESLSEFSQPASDARKIGDAEQKTAKSEQRDSSAAEWQADLLWALINSTEFAMTP